jgi:hypothetical protein
LPQGSFQERQAADNQQTGVAMMFELTIANAVMPFNCRRQSSGNKPGEKKTITKCLCKT